MSGTAKSGGMAAGALAGLKVLEFAAIGPVPYCGMLFSDMGADVLRIDRPGAQYDRYMVETRGRRSLVLDLKQPRDVETALGLAGKADVLLEGLRPGVMERLGIGPDVVPMRACPGMTSISSRSPEPCTRSARRNDLCRRSTWWAISAAARCTWRWVCWRR
jgi:crotonobetainyl-CoA:carnitine CoA-transferase CaiB-like acyl-CoA transferase